MRSLWIYDAKLAKVLRGYIVALDVEKRKARIRTYGGSIPISLGCYMSFYSDGLDDLADSLRTYGYNDYDCFIHRVKIALDKDNEMMWAKRLPADDPVYALELEKSLIKREITKEEYRVKEEYLDWLISFFSKYWPEFALDSSTDYCTSIYNPRMCLGKNNTIECAWGNAWADDTLWELHATIDLEKHMIEGTGTNKLNQLTGYNFSLNLDNEEDRKKLFEVLKILDEKIEEDEEE